MFDLGATELLVIVIVAVVVIGPKDLPLALRTAGRWMGRIRRFSNHFRSGLDAMIREAELEEMEEKWKAQNEKVMREHPMGAEAEPERTGAFPVAAPTPAIPASSAASATPATGPATDGAPSSSAPSSGAEAAMMPGGGSPDPAASSPSQVS